MKVALNSTKTKKPFKEQNVKVVSSRKHVAGASNEAGKRLPGLASERYLYL